MVHNCHNFSISGIGHLLGYDDGRMAQRNIREMAQLVSPWSQFTFRIDRNLHSSNTTPTSRAFECSSHVIISLSGISIFDQIDTRLLCLRMAQPESWTLEYYFPYNGLYWRHSGDIPPTKFDARGQAMFDSKILQEKEAGRWWYLGMRLWPYTWCSYSLGASAEIMGTS